MKNLTQQEREMDLEDLITSRSGDVLRLKAKADAAMPEMAKVWRDEARRAASDVARLVALRSPEAVRRLERVGGSGDADYRTPDAARLRLAGLFVHAA